HPGERVLGIAVVGRGARGLARLGATAAVGNLPVDRRVVDGVVAGVEEDGHPGDAGGRARGGQDRGGAQGHRHDTGDLQDVAACDGPQTTGAIAHRAMVAIGGDGFARPQLHTKKYVTVGCMSVVDSRPLHGITDEFVARLADRAEQAERLRRLPSATVDDFRQTDLFRLLLPARFGGIQASFPELLQPIRRMAHGCASSAWTLGFYALHNWMLSLFDPRAQEEDFASGPVLAPAPLAPTGRGVPVDGGVRLTGRWSWATGAMDADWVIVGALIERQDRIDPALAVVPAGEVEVDDVWHTAGMRGTGSHDVVVTDVFIPEHRIVAVADIYGGTSPGAREHGVPTY